MSNKQIKNIISEKINKEDIKNNIVNKRSIDMKYLKYGVCTCALILMIGVFAFSGNKVNDIKTESYSKNNFSINELDSIASRTLDAESREVNEKDLESDFSFYKDLVLSDLLKGYKVEGIYIKDSNDKYNKLNNYLVSTYTENNSIKIAFSKDCEPLRDYFFDDNGEKYTTINGEDIKIYNYGNSYMTVFSYNGVNFDIETSNMDINEFVNILKLIIK